MTGGAVEGWDKSRGNNQGWSGIGNVTYTLTDQRHAGRERHLGAPSKPTRPAKKKRGRRGLRGTIIRPRDDLPAQLRLGDYEDAAAAGKEGRALAGVCGGPPLRLTDRASAAVRGSGSRTTAARGRHGCNRCTRPRSRANNSSPSTSTASSSTGTTSRPRGRLPKDSPGRVNSSTGPIPDQRVHRWTGHPRLQRQPTCSTEPVSHEGLKGGLQ